MITPVITAATGMLTKSLEENLKATTRKHSIDFAIKDSYIWNIRHNT